MKRQKNPIERFSHSVMVWTGSTPAFAVAFGFILVWAATGPFFGFSNTWQLVVNTGTTIATFLMVFLIQRAQNKDSKAVALKLNEIVAAIEGASNRLIDVEDSSEHELDALHAHYAQLARMAKHDGVLTKAHSIEEARLRHEHKQRRRDQAPVVGKG